MAGRSSGSFGNMVNGKPYYVIGSMWVLQGIGATGTAPIAMALSSDIFTSSDRSKSLSSRGF